MPRVLTIVCQFLLLCCLFKAGALRGAWVECQTTLYIDIENGRGACIGLVAAGEYASGGWSGANANSFLGGVAALRFGHVLSGYGDFSVRHMHWPADRFEVWQDTGSFGLGFGDPVADRFNVFVGRFPLPFGYTLSQHLGIHDWLKPDEFMPESGLGAQLAFDNYRDLRVEVGLQRTTKSVFASKSEPEVAMRLLYDFTALGSSRLMLSAEGNWERSYGLALTYLNRNQRGDQNRLEWVRVVPYSRQEPFKQWLAFAHETAVRNRMSWTVEYQEARLQFRMVIIGLEYLVGRYFSLRSFLTYQNQQVDGVQWWGSLGFLSKL